MLIDELATHPENLHSSPQVSPVGKQLHGVLDDLISCVIENKDELLLLQERCRNAKASGNIHNAGSYPLLSKTSFAAIKSRALDPRSDQFMQERVCGVVSKCHELIAETLFSHVEGFTETNKKELFEDYAVCYQGKDGQKYYTDRQCRAKVMVATEVDFQGNGGFSVLQQLKPEYWLEDWDGVKSASADRQRCHQDSSHKKKYFYSGGSYGTCLSLNGIENARYLHGYVRHFSEESRADCKMHQDFGDRMLFVMAMAITINGIRVMFQITMRLPDHLVLECTETIRKHLLQTPLKALDVSVLSSTTASLSSLSSSLSSSSSSSSSSSTTTLLSSSSSLSLSQSRSLLTLSSQEQTRLKEERSAEVAQAVHSVVERLQLSLTELQVPLSLWEDLNELENVSELQALMREYSKMNRDPTREEEEMMWERLEWGEKRAAEAAAEAAAKAAAKAKNYDGRYRCEPCQKNFGGASGLWYHNNNKHAAAAAAAKAAAVKAKNYDGRYRCEQCQKNYGGASGLWYHKKHVHGAETQKYQKSKRGKKRTSAHNKRVHGAAAQSQVIAKKKTRFEEHNS